MAALDSEKAVQMIVVASQSEKRCCRGVQPLIEHTRERQSKNESMRKGSGMKKLRRKGI
jgi:hypothetical protein